MKKVQRNNSHLAAVIDKKKLLHVSFVQNTQTRTERATFYFSFDCVCSRRRIPRVHLKYRTGTATVFKRPRSGNRPGNKPTQLDANFVILSKFIKLKFPPGGVTISSLRTEDKERRWYPASTRYGCIYSWRPIYSLQIADGFILHGVGAVLRSARFVCRPGASLLRVGWAVPVWDLVSSGWNVFKWKSGLSASCRRNFVRGLHNVSI